MRVADMYNFKVRVADRGEVNLREIMSELKVDRILFPHRVYFENRHLVVVGLHRASEPYYEVTLDLGSNLPPAASWSSRQTIFQPSVVDTKPIPYVCTWAPLYEYEPGKLFRWSQRRKKRAPAFGQDSGPLIFEVLGKAEKGLRVRLPQGGSGEWILATDLRSWLDRRLTALELRLWELWLDNPFRNDHRHPLTFVDRLREYAFNERWVIGDDGEPYAWMATESWEEERQHLDLGIDEAIIAVKNGILTGSRFDWDFLPEDRVSKYLLAKWGPEPAARSCGR